MVASLAPRPAHRALVTPLLAVLGLVLAGCTYIAPMDTQRSMNPADGLNFTLGTDQATVASLLIVGTQEGEPGVLVARVVNDGEDPVSVSITGAGLDEKVDVPVGQTADIGGVDKRSQKIIVDSVPQAPGYLVPLTFSLPDGTSKKVQAPVLDGTFDRYKPYLAEIDAG